MSFLHKLLFWKQKPLTENQQAEELETAYALFKEGMLVLNKITEEQNIMGITLNNLSANVELSEKLIDLCQAQIKIIQRIKHLMRDDSFMEKQLLQINNLLKIALRTRKKHQKLMR
jgi:hypothetical protein